MKTLEQIKETIELDSRNAFTKEEVLSLLGVDKLTKVDEVVIKRACDEVDRVVTNVISQLDSREYITINEDDLILNNICDNLEITEVYDYALDIYSLRNTILDDLSRELDEHFSRETIDEALKVCLSIPPFEDFDVETFDWWIDGRKIVIDGFEIIFHIPVYEIAEPIIEHLQQILKNIK